MYLQDLHVTSPWPWLRLALQSSILATTSHPLAEGRFLVASAAAAREPGGGFGIRGGEGGRVRGAGESEVVHR